MPSSAPIKKGVKRIYRKMPFLKDQSKVRFQKVVGGNILTFRGTY